MTKRACPFDTTIYRQLKVHVNNIENDQEALREIHEKTLKKLLTGVQNEYSNVEPSSKPVVPICHTPEDWKKEKLLKQKHVTNYFTNNNVKKFTENVVECSKPPEALKICFYCDNKTDCIYECHKCYENYCQACCFTNYGSSEEDRVCLTCS